MGSCLTMSAPAHTSAHQHRPAHTSAHQQTPADTSAHQHEPAETSKHHRTAAYTSTHLRTPARTSTHQHRPAHTSARHHTSAHTSTHACLFFFSICSINKGRVRKKIKRVRIVTLEFRRSKASGGVETSSKGSLKIREKIKRVYKTGFPPLVPPVVLNLFVL